MAKIILETVERTEAFWQRGIAQYNKLIERLNTMFTELYLTHERAEFHLTSPETIIVNDDGVTWVKVPNMVLNLGSGFSVTDGTLTYTGDGGIFKMDGVSDLEANKACEIYYGLFVNGSVVPHEVTPHTFSNQSKVENISITALANLSTGDYIEIKVLGDGVTADVEITTPKLDVTFWGE